MTKSDLFLLKLKTQHYSELVKNTDAIEISDLFCSRTAGCVRQRFLETKYRLMVPGVKCSALNSPFDFRFSYYIF